MKEFIHVLHHLTTGSVFCSLQVKSHSGTNHFHKTQSSSNFAYIIVCVCRCAFLNLSDYCLTTSIERG